MNWCGPFCGKFADEHADHTDDDGENDINENSTFANMVAKKQDRRWTFFRRKKKVGNSDSKDGKSTNTRTMWSSYCTYTSLTMKAKGGLDSLQKVVLIKATKATLRAGMVNGIPDVGQVHTIELHDCQLSEVPPYLNNIDTLVNLRLTNNKIRKVQKEIGLCSKLETLHLGWNQISQLDADLFQDKKSFPQLEVVNLRHNRLEYLPVTFGMTASKPSKIKHLDLSENMIQVLPDSINALKDSLQFLDVSHNRLVRLPRIFDFPKLNKLFIAFNELVELPDGVGDCLKLEKLRMTNNHIRKIPDSFLRLKDTLHDFEVEGNPLVVPSATAFTMGGVKQAFKLLEEHVNEVNEAMRKAQALLPSPEQLALENADAGLKAQHSLLQDNSGDDLGLHHAPTHVLDYYFSHCKGEEREDMIRDIRNAESTLLIIKRNVYFEKQKNLAKKASESGRDNVPKTMREFLEPGYDVNKWHGDARVLDLDLYFNLLVYTTKPLYSSCSVLFDRFEMDNKEYLNKDEWEEFLLFSPILLENPSINEGMWQLMAWRYGDRIPMVDFIAAWHIHDVDAQDPWISRMAQVLRLDYYNMDIAELQNRLKAKDAEDATPVLNFDGPEADSDDDVVEDGENEITLEREEGERFVIADAHKGKQKRTTEQVVETTKDDGRKITSTDEKEQEAKQDKRKDRQDDEGSDVSVNSAELSEDEDSDVDSDFDVETRLQATAIGGGADQGRLLVDSQEALDKLMTIDPKVFFPDNTQPTAVVNFSKHSKTRTPKKQNRVATDGRFKTDVFPAQQEIRRVYRNLPYEDFVKLISFLLRGMQMIKHSKSRSQSTFWHADDPTFKFTMGAMGSNLYTRRLLSSMGFALLDQLYWVWPSIHMKEVLADSKKKIPIWGVEEIPNQCQGMEPGRLEDMILLLTNCQRSLHKLGKEKFNGSFR